jgi:hypothetical protein
MRAGSKRQQRQRNSNDGCGGGRHWQWQMTTMADNDGTQDWVADYEGEGQERAARDSGDSIVVMMTEVTEDSGDGQ